MAAEFRYGTSKKSHDDRADGSMPVLRIPNVVDGVVNLDGLKHTVLEAKEVQRLTLQKGDLLFVRTNGNPEYIGRCAVFDIDQAAPGDPEKADGHVHLEAVLEAWVIRYEL